MDCSFAKLKFELNYYSKIITYFRLFVGINQQFSTDEATNSITKFAFVAHPHEPKTIFGQNTALKNTGKAPETLLLVTSNMLWITL